MFLASALAFNTVLKTVDFSKNGIEADGAVALAENLRENRALGTLKLGSNSVGDAGARELAGVLAAGQESVFELDLSGNNIGDEGARALARMLRENRRLVKLDLSNNEVDYEGTAALAQALAENRTLRALHLGNNYVGVMGARALAEGLRRNAALEELHVGATRSGTPAPPPWWRASRRPRARCASWTCPTTPSGRGPSARWRTSSPAAGPCGT